MQRDILTHQRNNIRRKKLNRIKSALSSFFCIDWSEFEIELLVTLHGISFSWTNPGRSEQNMLESNVQSKIKNSNNVMFLQMQWNPWIFYHLRYCMLWKVKCLCPIFIWFTKCELMNLEFVSQRAGVKLLIRSDFIFSSHIISLMWQRYLFAL